MRVRIEALFVGAMALSACATIGGPGSSTYYECGQGTRLKVDSLPGGAVQVQMNGDKPIVLPREKSASGAKYSNGQHVFWSKGDEASWTVGRMVPMQCRQVAVPR